MRGSQAPNQWGELALGRWGTHVGIDCANHRWVCRTRTPGRTVNIMKLQRKWKQVCEIGQEKKKFPRKTNTFWVYLYYPKVIQFYKCTKAIGSETWGQAKILEPDVEVGNLLSNSLIQIKYLMLERVIITYTDIVTTDWFAYQINNVFMKF